MNAIGLPRVARYEPTAEEATFIDRFEDCTLPNTAFRHTDHLRLTWLYLRMYPLLEALNRFVVGLKRFAASNHHANLYHETITWAFVLITNERIERFGSDHTWPEFEERNRDFIEDGRAVLGGFYSSKMIESDLARRVFLMPDRAPE